MVPPFHSMPNQMRYWKYSAFLNNAGVSFLVRGMFDWALETFHGALDIVTCLCISVPVEVDVSTMLMRATRRLAGAGTFAVFPEHILNVISLDDALNDSRRFFFREHNNNSTVISLNETDIDVVGENIKELVPSILLMNYAAATLTMSKFNGVRSATHRNIWFMHIALNLIGHEGDSGSMILMHPCRLIVVSCVLHNFDHMYREQLDHEQFYVTKKHLSILKQVVLAKFSIPLTCRNAPAA